MGSTSTTTDEELYAPNLQMSVGLAKKLAPVSVTGYPPAMACCVGLMYVSVGV